MDVDREFAQLQRRLDASLAMKVIAAEARLYGMSVKAYQDKRVSEAVKSAMTGWAAVGRYYRDLNDQLVAAMQAFTKGWNSK